MSTAKTPTVMCGFPYFFLSLKGFDLFWLALEHLLLSCPLFGKVTQRSREKEKIDLKKKWS
jgi:hypothetical protein